MNLTLWKSPAAPSPTQKSKISLLRRFLSEPRGGFVGVTGLRLVQGGLPPHEEAVLIHDGSDKIEHYKPLRRHTDGGQGLITVLYEIQRDT